MGAVKGGFGRGFRTFGRGLNINKSGCYVAVLCQQNGSNFSITKNLIFFENLILRFVQCTRFVQQFVMRRTRSCERSFTQINREAYMSHRFFRTCKK